MILKMKWTQKYFFIIPLFFLIFCKEQDKLAKEIEKIPVDLKVIRFDLEFAAASSNDIPKLKSKYPYLFPRQFSDSIWVAKSTDTIQQELLAEVNMAFGDFNQQEMELTSLFQHIVYYFPNYKPPKVITLTSDVQYDNRVVLTDTLLLLGLDNYLGADHHFYQRISQYISKGLDQKYLISDVASAFANTINWCLA